MRSGQTCFHVSQFVITTGMRHSCKMLDKNPVSVLFVIILLTSPVRADQTDPRLDALFEQLHSAADIRQGNAIAARIWVIWSDSHDEAINRLLEEGEKAMAQRDLRTALKLFDHIVEQAPDFAEGWNKRATIQYMSGNYRESLADIEHTLKLEPRHFGALSGRGLCYLKLENPAQASNAFEAALAINPWLESIHNYVKELDRMLKTQSI